MRAVMAESHRACVSEGWGPSKLHFRRGVPSCAIGHKLAQMRRQVQLPLRHAPAQGCVAAPA